MLPLDPKSPVTATNAFLATKPQRKFLVALYEMKHDVGQYKQEVQSMSRQAPLTTDKEAMSHHQAPLTTHKGALSRHQAPLTTHKEAMSHHPAPLTTINTEA